MGFAWMGGGFGLDIVFFVREREGVGNKEKKNKTPETDNTLYVDKALSRPRTCFLDVFSACGRESYKQR